MQVRYEMNQNEFNFIPTNSLNYWFSKSIINVFKNGTAINSLFDVRKGADTGDNNKYIREWWEIMSNHSSIFSKNDTWVPYVKGGEFRRWYGNKQEVIYYKNNGYDLKHSKANLRSPHLYFKKTITWSAISSAESSFRINDSLGLFDSAGSSMKPNDDDFLYVLGAMNSVVACDLLKSINPTLNYGAGSVGLFPLIESDNQTKYSVSSLAEKNASQSKRDWDSFETSWDFKKHPLI